MIRSLLIIPGVICLFFSPNSHSAVNFSEEAAKCNVVAFSPYMETSAKAMVEEFSHELNSINSLSDGIYKKAKEIFVKVEQEHTKVRIFLSGNHDEFFKKYFGYVRPEAEKNLNLPLPFEIQVALSWNNECKVVQQVSSCLKDKRDCKETNLDKSLIQFHGEGERWEIVKTPGIDQDFGAIKRASVAIKNVTIWVHDYLESYDASIPLAEFEAGFIKGYVDAAMSEFSKVQ